MPTRLILLLAAFFILAGPLAASPTPDAPPWQKAGLTARQAAAHLLDRFAFGARPGDVDRVTAMGPLAWLDEQLGGDLADPEVDRRLASFDSLGLSVRQTVERYPNPGLILAKMRREGMLADGAAAGDARPPADGDDRDAMRSAMMAYGRDAGYRPQRELIGELFAQKLLRAVYSENQLHEVLVDFWFNHFNVSITDNDVRPYVGPYERDAIRPFVVGRFRDLLEATAKHPAMLLYLDNARSVAEEGVNTTFDADRFRQRFSRGRGGSRRFARLTADRADAQRASRRPSGLNENYARELMELHTLGVDGGYDQQDVIEVARAFSGWTLEPPRMMLDESASRRFGFARRLPPSAGFVFADSFLFRADVHDAEAKTVLGTKLPAGRGIEDGETVLDLLAVHPSTARHLARKLAVRFVSDEPPEEVVDAISRRFRASGGDLGEAVRALAWSDAFWSPAARHQKIKSPFELAVSSLRALDADVRRPRAVLEWVARIGQPLYAYQAPTGYPDRSEAWVNTGSLLARMNFGLQLASGQVLGVRFDLAALNGGQEPASLDDALRVYVPLLLPTRDPEATVRRLEPAIRDPSLADKLRDRSQSAEQPDDWMALAWGDDAERFGDSRRGRRGRERRQATPPPTTGPFGHVVGVILGSPDFQRR